MKSGECVYSVASMGYSALPADLSLGLLVDQSFDLMAGTDPNQAPLQTYNTELDKVRRAIAAASSYKVKLFKAYRRGAPGWC